MKPNTSCIAFLFWVTGFMTAAVAGEMHRSPEEKLNALLNTSSTLTVNLVQKSKKSKITQKNVINFLKTYSANKILPDLTNVSQRSLPQIPLEKWLVSIMGDAPLEWSSGECIANDSDIEESDVEDESVQAYVTARAKSDFAG